MSDAVALLREKEAKLGAKVGRARTSLHSAESELAEVRTALKVLVRMGLAPEGEDAEPAAGKETMNHDQALVVSCVPFGEPLAVAPKEVLLTLARDHDTITGDYIRTTLWRMARRGVLMSKNGLYWRPVDATARGENEAAPDEISPEAAFGAGPLGGERGYPPSAPEGSIPSGSTPPNVGEPMFDDDDVPF